MHPLNVLSKDKISGQKDEKHKFSSLIHRPFLYEFDAVWPCKHESMNKQQHRQISKQDEVSGKMLSNEIQLNTNTLKK